MAHAIGSYQAHRILKGHVDPLGMGVLVETRPGVSGYDLTELGYRGEDFEVTTFRDYDSESDMHAGFTTAKGLQGRVVTVVDAHGRSWGNILVRRVLEPEKPRYLAAAGGETAGVWGLVLRWVLMAV